MKEVVRAARKRNGRWEWVEATGGTIRRGNRNDREWQRRLQYERFGRGSQGLRRQRRVVQVENR